MLKYRHLNCIILLILSLVIFCLLGCYPKRDVVITIISNVDVEVQSLSGKAGDDIDFEMPIVADSDFVGFYSDSNFTTFYANELNSFPSANLTLYAKYAPRALYKLTFDSEGGSAIKSFDVFAGESLLTYQPNNPTKNGYHFVGWSTQREQGSLFDFSSEMPQSGLTLFAQWSRDLSKSHYKFFVNGSIYKEEFLDEGELLREPQPPNLESGQIFEGWYLAMDSKQKPDFDTVIEFDDSLSNIDQDGAYCVYANFYTQGILTADGVLLGYSGASSNVILPWVKDGHLVESIANRAFMSKNIRTISLPKSIKSIGQQAFYGCSVLGAIVLPSGLETIGEQAFNLCTQLESIVIPKGTALDFSRAFSGCTALVDIIIAEGSELYVSHLGGVYSADFKQLIKCSPGLSHFSVREGTEAIATLAFDSETLSSLIIPNSVTVIETGAIRLENSRLSSISLPAVSNSQYTSGSGVVSIFNLAALFGALTYSENMGNSIYFNSLYVPSTLESVNITAIYSQLSYSFYGCFYIKSITLPDQGVEYIGAGAFFLCYSLEEIVIPNTVTEISGGSILNAAFYYCSSLKSITLPSLSGGYLSYIFGASHYTDVLNMGGLLMPFTFFLEEVIITSEAISELSNGAFYGNKSLKRIELMSKIKKIGYKCFYDCSALEEVSSLEYVEELGYDTDANLYSGAFAYCHNLKNFKLPSLCRGIIGKDAFLGVGVLHDKIPFEIGEGVEAIMNYAFMDCTSFLSIKIPSSVLYIGVGAFYNCISITSLVIPSTVQVIAPSALERCDALVSLQLPMHNNIEVTDEDSNTQQTFFLPIYFGAMNLTGNKYKISGADFHYVPRSLKSVVFNYCVPDMSLFYSFYNCEFVESISLYQGIVAIGESSFYGCVSLTTITIPPAVSSISGGAFSFATSLVEYRISDSEYFSVLDGVLYSRDLSTLISFPSGKSANPFVVPEGVTHIESFAFSGNNSILRIVLPSTLVSVGSSIFQNSPNIVEISSKTTVFDIDYLNEGMLIGDEDRVLYAYFGAQPVIEIAGSVKGIAAHAFSNLTFLQKIIIGKNVQSIGRYAFMGIDADVEFEAGSVISEIGDHAFFSYLGQSIVLPDSVISLGTRSFEASLITSIELPSGLTDVGDYAFFNCTSLSQLIISDNSMLRIIGEGAFAGCAISDFAIPSRLEEIGDYAFAYNKLVSFDSLDTNLFRIGRFSFYANALELIKVSKKINTISEWAFAYNSSLRDLYIEEGVEFIGDYAFCADIRPFGSANPLSMLSEISIPASVQSIGKSAFMGVGHYVVPSGEDGIYWYFTVEIKLTFKANSKLREIGDNAFDMTRLGETLDLSMTSLEQIGSYAFANFVVTALHPDYYSLKRVIFPDTLTTIGDGAFYAQVSLNELVIPKSVQHIGEAAFYQCHSLTKVIILCVTPPKLGSAAFDLLPIFFVDDLAYGHYLASEEWHIFIEHIRKFSEMQSDSQILPTNYTQFVQ